MVIFFSEYSDDNSKKTNVIEYTLQEEIKIDVCENNQTHSFLYQR